MRVVRLRIPLKRMQTGDIIILLEGPYVVHTAVARSQHYQFEYLDPRMKFGSCLFNMPQSPEKWFEDP